MLAGLLIPYLVGVAIDDLAKEITWQKTLVYPLLILLASLVSGVFLFLQRRILIDTSRHIEYDIRKDFFSSLICQPLVFFQNNRVGDLMARATNDLAAVRQIVGPMILYSFQAIFAILVVLPVMISISIKLTFLLFLIMPLVSVAVKVLGQIIHTRFEKVQEKFSEITAMVQENLTGMRVIKAFSLEEFEIKRFERLNREYALKNLSLVKYSAAMRPLLFFLIGLGFVVIIAVGVPMAVRDEISAGDFTAFILYLQRMVWYLVAMGYVVNLYQRGVASLRRIRQIQEIEPAIKDSPEVVDKSIKGDIEFRNLNFFYNGVKVLKNINLKIENGRMVAFVGRTGSGKSTLMSLIPRLLEAPEDTVFIDGISVKKYRIKDLRRAIGFVPQESFLFSDTLLANITFGIEEADPEKLRKMAEKAAEFAGLSKDIELFPNGFDQVIGERGITLSGGQKQRVSIARAIIHNPRILILDDAFSSVDIATEEIIMRNLRAFRKDKTVLIVSHRISTVRDADMIFVLKEGEIVEFGKHEELLNLKGEYASLYQRQLIEEDIQAKA